MAHMARCRRGFEPTLSRRAVEVHGTDFNRVRVTRHGFGLEGAAINKDDRVLPMALAKRDPAPYSASRENDLARATLRADARLAATAK
jgi:hypothetical protein